jgi:hypothetical protein
MGNSVSSIWDVHPNRPLGEYFYEDGRRSSVQYWNNRIRTPANQVETHRTTTRPDTNRRSVHTRNGSRTRTVPTTRPTTGGESTRSRRTSSSENTTTTRRTTTTSSNNSTRGQSTTSAGGRSNRHSASENSNPNRLSSSYVQRNTYLGGQSVHQLIERKMLAPWESGQDEPRDSSGEECPICFAFYTFLNYTACCNKPVCTSCFVAMHKMRRRGATSVCPFCNAEPMEIVFYGESTPQKLMEEALRESVGRQVNQLNVEISLILKSWEEQPNVVDMLKNSGETLYANKDDIFSILPNQISLSEGKSISLYSLYVNSESFLSSLSKEEITRTDLAYLEAVFGSLHDICFRILADIAMYSKLESQILGSASSSSSFGVVVGGKHSNHLSCVNCCVSNDRRQWIQNESEEDLIVFDEGRDDNENAGG